MILRVAPNPSSCPGLFLGAQLLDDVIDHLAIGAQARFIEPIPVDDVVNLADIAVRWREIGEADRNRLVAPQRIRDTEQRLDLRLHLGRSGVADIMRAETE